MSIDDEAYYEYIDIQKIEKEDHIQRDPDVYKLGQDVANGVRYFGQERMEKKTRKALFICPFCNETWRASIANVECGNTKSCGCKK